mmetsp:Transcript_52726/g.83683  ORF Transcript_52726/g.83683 Transcript_52726/m.83683 type:complete len:547 (-) Transcript_52726:165-1805(-)
MADLKDFSDELDKSNPTWRDDYQGWRRGDAKGAKGEKPPSDVEENVSFDIKRVRCHSTPLESIFGGYYEASSVSPYFALADAMRPALTEGEDEPLLESKISTAATTSSLVTAMIGSSLLAMPALASKAGIILGPIVMIVAALIVNEMGKLISESIDDVAAIDGINVRKYQDLTKSAIGDAFSKLVGVSSTCALTGFVTVSCVLIGQSFQMLVPQLTYKMWMVIMIPMNIGFANVRDMNYIARLGQLGVLACMFCVVIMYTKSLEAVDSNWKWPDEYRTVGAYSDVPKPLYSLGPRTLLSLGSVSAVAFFTFAVLVSIPTVKGNMQKPEELPKALNRSFAICTAVNLLGMVFGYWGFGNFVNDNVLQNFRVMRPTNYWQEDVYTSENALTPWETGRPSAAGQAMCIALIANLICSYPIYQICIALAIESSSPTLQTSVAKSTMLRTFLGIFTITIGLLLPFFLQILALISSVFCVLNNVFLPLACYHGMKKRMGKSISTTRHVVHGFCGIVGIMVLCCGLIDAVSELASKAKMQPELANPTKGWFVQ